MSIITDRNKITLAIIKPDAYYRKEKIIHDFASVGLSVLARKTFKKFDCAAEFYNIHAGKLFYKTLVQVMQFGPVEAMILKGDNAVEVARQKIGDKDPLKAALNTIRDKFGTDINHHSVHVSDSWEDAIREIGIVFKDFMVWERNEDGSVSLRMF